MPLVKLKEALAAVDWAKNIDTFISDAKAAQKLADVNLKLAIWAAQLENADKGNAALCFVREMQIAGQLVAVLVSLSLYKPAASSMRSALETALYYSYFRTHPSELETLVRKTGYYLEKREVIEFHKAHTARFSDLQKALGVLSRLDKWYGNVSSLVHGHLPGAWIEHKSVAEIKPIKATQDLAVATFAEGGDIINRFLLCTVAQQLWDAFSSSAKKQLLSGLHGDEKKILKLDAA